MRYLVFPWNPKDLKNCWEYDWIRFLTKYLKLNEIINLNYAQTLPDFEGAIYVITRKHAWPDKKCFQEPYGLIHLSDEYYEVSPSDYPENAKFIYRNYYNSRFDGNPRIHHFPLGYKQGVYKPKNIGKHFNWTFAGCLGKNDRFKIIESMKKISNFYIHNTSAWNSQDCLDSAKYSLLLSQGKYVPSPPGNHAVECFRTWEILECGSVPLTENNDYYRKLCQSCQLDPPPWIELSSWDNHEFFEHDYSELLNRCESWWSASKQKLQLQFLSSWITMLKNS